MNASKMISLHEISMSFLENKPVLKNLNLDLHRGETISILGSGGSGKSSLIKVGVGLIKPQSGKITLFGKDVSTLTEREHAALLRKVGIAFQQGALFDFMTVRENILFAMENMCSFSEKEQEKRVFDFLAQVNLPDVSDKMPRELSGGMRRRVGIVRAMVTNPELALLDEPTAGLDPVTTTIVIDMIHRIGKAVNATMVCVTSSVEVAFRFANKAAILKDGNIIGKGTKEELLAMNDPWVNHFLTVRKVNIEQG